MKVDTYIIDLVKDNIRQINKYIDSCHRKCESVQRCIHCNRHNMCQPCQDIIKSEQ